MNGRLCLVVVLLAVPLAGCMGGGSDADAALAAAEADARAVEPEGRGRILAFEETSAMESGAGGVDHDHDYWQGRERVELLRQTLSWGTAATMPRSLAVKPAQEALVFEATSSLEVHLGEPTRAGQPATAVPTPPLLLYKHAATTDWIEVGPMSWGGTSSILVTNPAQTDMPHATWSLWEFQLRTADHLSNGVAFELSVDILRGDDDVPLWPGHPAFYTDSRVRMVLDADAVAGEEGVAGDAVPVGAKPTGPVQPERVVSYGTRTLFVYVNISSMSVTNPLDEPTNFYLRHHNASGRWNATDYFDGAGKHGADVREHLWILRVDEGGMDSPYADGSRYAFELAAAFAQKTPVIWFTCYRGCATWSADYHITVLATDEVLPDDMYD